MKWGDSTKDTGLWFTTVTPISSQAIRVPLCHSLFSHEHTKHTISRPPQHINWLTWFYTYFEIEWRKLSKGKHFSHWHPYSNNGEPFLFPSSFIYLGEKLFPEFWWNVLYLYSSGFAISNRKVRVELYVFRWFFTMYSISRRNSLGKFYIPGIVPFASKNIKAVW